MRIPLFRIWYSTTYSVLCLLLVVLLAATPGDLVFQAVRNKGYQNAIAVGAVYFFTLLITVCVYATRLYTNRTVLLAIPKSYIPIEQGEVGKHVRRMIVKGFERSALIAWDSRPRDLRPELQKDAEEEQEESGGSSAPASPHTRDRARRTLIAIPVDANSPPWGHVSHPGWASPAAVGMPNLQFCNVVAELPNLIEAKAVSLAPPDPAAACALRIALDGSLPVMPDARIAAMLQRAPSMGLRDYLAHLSTLGLIDPPGLGLAFLKRYEYARFSTRPMTEVEFKELMAMFAQILAGMTDLAPELVADLEHAAYDRSPDATCLSVSSSTSLVGSAIRYRTPRTAPYEESQYSSSSAEVSESNITLRTAQSRLYSPSLEHVHMPRTPSAAPGSSSMRAPGPPSLRSARSVIRLTPSPGPGELPYYFDVENGP